MTLTTHLASLSGRCEHGAHLKTQGCRDCLPVAPTEPSTSVVDEHWPTFLAALHKAAVGGEVQQKNVRPLIRGVIPPNVIGSCYRRARDRRVLVEVDHERSDDHEGRNAGRMEPRYEMRSAA